jgi:hypothetical protein
MNSDLRQLMRILLTTEREETEVNTAQAHKEAQVWTTVFNDFVSTATWYSKCDLHTIAIQRNVQFKLENGYRNTET